jgi:hypothetical protein
MLSSVDIVLVQNNNPIQLWEPELTAESYLIDLRNRLLFERYRDREFKEYVRSAINYINNKFGSKFELVDVTDTNLILTNFGEEIILPEPLTRNVLIEKIK